MTGTGGHDYPLHQEVELDERQWLFRAAMALGRLDEALATNPSLFPIVQGPVLRSEATGILALSEALHCSEHTLVREILGVRQDLGTKAELLALGFYEALQSASRWPEKIEDSALRLVFEASEAHGVQIRTPETEWAIENASTEAAGWINQLFTTPSPWAAAEAVRRLWLSPAFEDKGRRIASIAALPLIARGFGCRYALAGVSVQFTADPDAVRDAVDDQEAFYAVFFRAVATSAAQAYAALFRIKRLQMEMLDQSAMKRGDSFIRPLVDHLLTTPLITTGYITSVFGVSRTTAGTIIDRLVKPGFLRATERSTKKYREFEFARGYGLVTKG